MSVAYNQLHYCATAGCTGRVHNHVASSLCRKCRQAQRPEAPTTELEARGLLMVDENGKLVDSARWIMKAMRGHR